MDFLDEFMIMDLLGFDDDEEGSPSSSEYDYDSDCYEEPEYTEEDIELINRKLTTSEMNRS